MHRDEHEGAPTPVGAATHSVGEPTPAVADPTPSRERTVEPIAEPTPFAIAITDAEELFAASTPLHERDPYQLMVAAQRSSAAASIAIAHMLHRLVQAVESGTLELGELVVATTEWADHGAEQLRYLRERAKRDDERSRERDQQGERMIALAAAANAQLAEPTVVTHVITEKPTDPNAN